MLLSFLKTLDFIQLDQSVFTILLSVSALVSSQFLSWHMFTARIASIFLIHPHSISSYMQHVLNLLIITSAEVH